MAGSKVSLSFSAPDWAAQLLLLCFVGVKSNVKYSALEEVGNET